MARPRGQPRWPRSSPVLVDGGRRPVRNTVTPVGSGGAGIVRLTGVCTGCVAVPQCGNVCGDSAAAAAEGSGQAVAVSLRDVAERSGVSVSTASRALRGSGRVSGATETRVRATAAALGYRPNASARALRTARSGFVGLVITNLANTSFHTVAEVIQREVASRGFQLMLTVTAGDPAAERAAVRTLAEHSAAGVSVVGADDGASEELRELGLPTIYLARRPAHPAGDCVLGDDIAGSRLAAEHLLGLGHRRIAVIAGPA